VTRADIFVLFGSMVHQHNFWRKKIQERSIWLASAVTKQKQKQNQVSKQFGLIEVRDA
jgi:hypothetical protein